MKMNSIFLKPVNRPIEGVIKADDEGMLRNEFEEYVLTNEVQQRLELFLDAYNNSTVANGAWISGFFGSGKSHLLKILALLLENRDIDGTKALDLFLPKIDNEFLRGDLIRAVKIPSQSILFNIDQRADVINKTQIDALVGVFFKVFDEMCGYYGKQGYIAQFERDLDNRGLYSAFKTAYRQISGRTWEDGREHAILESRSIDCAYAQITGEQESRINNILRSYREQHHLSIEDFARQVKAYIDKKGPNFRLNFFVDEVGQFIANNVKLMTNLQSVAESLATICQGRSWLVVTSQSDMGTVVGEMTQQTDDFSKIQARFATRLNLTSTNVAEVIQKRLLAKTDDGIRSMIELYHQHENNFGTLFGFTDGTRSFNPYKDRDEFIQTYPFVPYQFELFQLAIQNLSSHNAFEGRHSSVGERSMLAVFQEVAKSIAEMEIGQLATFDQMFEGIKNSIKTQSQKSVTTAERHLGKGFALKLLKALFLVKYVTEFKATLNNLTILMLERFDEDLPQLKKRVEEALNLLEQQTYIRRNGQLYEYLTDEEKDIEQEIKNTDVDQSVVKAELGKLIFDRTLKSKRIRYDANGQDYNYTQKLDDQLIGREHELTIHVISPFHEHADNEQTLMLQSTGRDELLVIMPVDPRLMQDLITYKRTEKYINQHYSTTQQDSVKRILTEKSARNGDRLKDLEMAVKTLLGKASLSISSTEIESQSEDAQTRISRAFQNLISRIYPNLRMLQGITWSESQLSEILRQYRDSLFIGEETSLPEAEQEMLSFINMNKSNGIRTSIKAVNDKFSRKPYGWYYAAIICILAKLCARGKVEVRADGNLLEDDRLEQALKNAPNHGNVILDPQPVLPPSQIRKAKEFYADYFHVPPIASEAKVLGREMADRFDAFSQELDAAIQKQNDFPFVSKLVTVRNEIQANRSKSYTWFLTDLIADEDRWLDQKEKIVDPILRFLNGAQGEIYREARSYLAAQASNFVYLENREREDAIHTIIDDPACYLNNHMNQVKSWLESLRFDLEKQIVAERDTGLTAITRLRKEILDLVDYGKLEDDKKQSIESRFSRQEDALRHETIIPVMREQIRRLIDDEAIALKNKIAEWVKEKDIEPTPSIKYVSRKQIAVAYTKNTVENEQELDQYMSALKEAWRKAIQEGKRIQLT
ncbi:MAG: BREX system P-loop protein BrxC [Bacillota bacterium]|nr:BREX system P-loop protein BrxC [Bacillota bacterium]